MKDFIQTLFDMESNHTPYIGGDGMAFWAIPNAHIMPMKFKAVELGLPVMERKWDKVTRGRGLTQITMTQRVYIENSTTSQCKLAVEFSVNVKTIIKIKKKARQRLADAETLLTASQSDVSNYRLVVDQTLAEQGGNLCPD